VPHYGVNPNLNLQLLTAFVTIGANDSKMIA